MRRSRKILLVVLGVVVALLVGGVLYARPLLHTATGYAAHNACAVVMVAGRPTEAAPDDLPSNPLVPLLRTDIDPSAGTATATLLGLFGSTAWHTPGLGCTLAADQPELTALPPLASPADLAPGQGWPDGDEVGPVPDEVDVERIEAAVDDAFAEDDPEGRSTGTRAVVVVHDGRIVAERYADGFGPDTPQLGWSMAKSVTNTVVGRLVADGVIDVGDDELLTAWADDGRAEITIDDLLRMASGLEWDEEYALGSTITDMLYLQPDMGAFAASQPLEQEPGTHQEYSSGDTNILCDVLQDRSGMDTAMVEQLVFGPLGMASATLEPDADGGLVCSSYLWATPRDWARFGLWVLQDGQWDGEQLLPEDWFDYSTDLVPPDGDDPIGGEDEGHAAHWWVNATADGTAVLPDVPADTFWASGHDGQRVFVVPSADLVVVRMGFTPDIPSDELGYGPLIAELVGAVGGD